MVTGFTQVFTSLTNPKKQAFSKGLPMLNEMSSALTNFFTATSQLQKKKYLMRWYKVLPELTALTNKVAKDVIYRWHFEPINPDDTSRNKILKANRFAQEIELRQIMFSQMIDVLVTGEGYGWLGRLTDEQVKGKIKELLNKTWVETKEKKAMAENLFLELKAEEGFADTDKVDEDILRPRKYRNIASSSMEVVFDEKDVMGYVQTVAGRKVEFTPKEIVRYTFMEVDGKVAGFTPVESLVVQLELLRQMWQNNLSLHKNGGHPDKLFVLEDIKTSTEAYKRIEEQLKKYKMVENKHGNMLFTGKVNVQDLNTMDTMMFSDLGLYITSVMAMQWQIPRSALPYIFKGANTKEDIGGSSGQGYWRNVEYAQMMFAETMNTQLWIPYFGVKLMFDNTYIQQDVQLQTAQQMKLGNLTMLDTVLGQNELQLSKTRTLRELGLTDSDVEERRESPMEEAMGNGMNNQLSKDQVEGPDKTNKGDAKREEQNSTIQQRGMKPTGVGKEMWFKETEAEMVDMDTFIQLYNEDKSFGPSPPRLFQKKGQNQTTFLFKSTDFAYRTIVPNEELFSNKVRIMNLGGGKIYNV